MYPMMARRGQVVPAAGAGADSTDQKVLAGDKGPPLASDVGGEIGATEKAPARLI